MIPSCYERNVFDISGAGRDTISPTFTAGEGVTMHVIDEYERLLVRIFLVLCLFGMALLLTMCCA